MNNEDAFLREVQNNINDFGFHITTVIDGVVPIYCYSIGLHDILGFELIFAGGIFYLKNSFYKIFNESISSFDNTNNTNFDFKLSKVDSSWASRMALGTFDYYRNSDIKFFQITPNNNFTKDIPDMSNKFDTEHAIWKWLESKWPYHVPSNSTVTTNLEILLGTEPVREIMRWEKKEWEMFSSNGSEFEKNEIRVVPLSLMIGLDKSIVAAIDLEVGKGIWREYTQRKMVLG